MSICNICFSEEYDADNPIINVDQMTYLNPRCKCNVTMHLDCCNRWYNLQYGTVFRCIMCNTPMKTTKSCKQRCIDIIIIPFSHITPYIHGCCATCLIFITVILFMIIDIIGNFSEPVNQDIDLNVALLYPL